MEQGEVSKQDGPMGPWVCGRKELTSKGVTLLLYQNRALEQTLVKCQSHGQGWHPAPPPSSADTGAGLPHLSSVPTTFLSVCFQGSCIRMAFMVLRFM